MPCLRHQAPPLGILQDGSTLSPRRLDRAPSVPRSACCRPGYSARLTQGHPRRRTGMPPPPAGAIRARDERPGAPGQAAHHRDHRLRQSSTGLAARRRSAAATRPAGVRTASLRKSEPTARRWPSLRPFDARPIRRARRLGSAGATRTDAHQAPSVGCGERE